MNIKLVVFSLFLCTLSLTSCGDDDPVCSRSELIGTWEGTELCTGNSVDSSILIVIVEGLSDDEISVDGGSFETDALTLDDCSLSGGNSAFGTGFEYAGSLSNGELSLTHKVITFGAAVSTCDYILVKK